MNLPAIESKTVIGVVGLGYVGLPVACALAGAGFRSVIGIDSDPLRVRDVNGGRCPFPNEPGLPELLAEAVATGRLRAVAMHYASLSEADVILVCVATPVGPNHEPLLDDMLAALRGLRPVVKNGALVIIESTLAPGTMRNVVQQELPGVALGYCPERLTAGKLLHNLRTMPRVCGADSPEVGEAMVALYRHIVDASLTVTDWITAEFVKVVENAYRDTNIAFANQVAMLCEGAGADVWWVRELVNQLSDRQMMAPGVGVGGHCIPKDTWLLAATATRDEYPDLLEEVRLVNSDMPGRVAQAAIRLVGGGLHWTRRRAAILGYAYRENTADTRNTPAEAVARELAVSGWEVAFHDPLVERYNKSLREVVKGVDVVILVTGHDAYREIDLCVLAGLVGRKNLIDGRHFFDGAAARAAGFNYWCVGVGDECD